MTKRWSSTASMDGQTKREASKANRRAARDVLDAEKAMAEAERDGWATLEELKAELSANGQIRE